MKLRIEAATIFFALCFFVSLMAGENIETDCNTGQEHSQSK